MQINIISPAEEGPVREGNRVKEIKKNADADTLTKQQRF